MTDKQLLTKYETERGALMAQRTLLDTRLQAVDDVIGGLRVMLGERPPATKRTGAGKATGTKALILDVLARGERHSLKGLADAVKAHSAAVAKHLATLVEAGDVLREGKSRATSYRIA